MPTKTTRYGNIKKYKKRCRKAHLRTNGLCTVCLLNKSEQIHHSSYRKSGDRYGINIFPVCRHCHFNVCHSPQNWIVSLVNPTWKNHNTPAFTALLKRNYKRINKTVRTSGEVN